METLIDYLQMWEARRPDQTLYRFVDAEGRELERYTYESFAERTRELAAYLSVAVAISVSSGLPIAGCPQVARSRRGSLPMSSM